ncbi:WbqC family protein [Ichthyenterobacterium magnum]|uniref:WbqC-like protein n=1 Tax=Ichthyenterobacterium magnum TaxID=1230530 RepID=A0A420DV15_9FLAO|nr:WbqC family protein [Ichthyenterobacterium magnum]RKE97998.1 WbqC-like protein [Ichthyenterobacterium magnum]
MKVAIMQPYIFPYIGYFQLINAVDTFVFFDDVNFIKKGFINRNNLLIKGERSPFTISCKKISQNKFINKTELNFDSKEISKLLFTIKHNYNKAPYFKNIYPLLENFFCLDNKKTISVMAAESTMLVAKYLNLNTTFKYSSISHHDSISLKGENRIITICKKEKAIQYINPIGGVDLYEKPKFKVHNIDLNFLKPNAIPYKQFNNDFVPWLSIIDVLMFNSINSVKQLLNNYELL